MHMKNTLTRIIAAAAVVAGGATLAAQTVKINGAGATFPNPIYSKWFSEYNKLHPNIEINYQSIGSGGGIRQITNQTVFFGATDGPMTHDQLLAAPGKILHFPTVLGGDVPVYNIPGVTAELQVHGPAAGGHLPREDHEVERRGDREAQSWCVAAGDRHHRRASLRRVRHDLHLGGLPVEGVAGVEAARRRGAPRSTGRSASAAKATRASSGLVSQTPGAIGYVELIYALQNKISYGSVQNAAGKFLRASDRIGDSRGRRSGRARCRRTSASRSRTRPGADAYPISSFTWLLFYENPKDKAQAKIMVDFMKWALTDGQKFAG